MRRLQSSMSPSSFPPTVPCPGAALCSTGSLGSVPPCLRSYCGTPTSSFPASLARACSAVPALLHRRKLDLPSSSATLATHAPALRSRWNRWSRASGTMVPTFRSTGVAFRACRPVGFHHVLSFGVQFRGLRARCLRFAARVSPGPRKTRFRLAALPCRAGVQPARSLRQVCNHVLAFTWFPPDRSLLAHGKIKRSHLDFVGSGIAITFSVARHLVRSRGVCRVFLADPASRRFHRAPR